MVAVGGWRGAVGQLAILVILVGHDATIGDWWPHGGGGGYFRSAFGVLL